MNNWNIKNDPHIGLVLNVTGLEYETLTIRNFNEKRFDT